MSIFALASASKLPSGSVVSDVAAPAPGSCCTAKACTKGISEALEASDAEAFDGSDELDENDVVLSTSPFSISWMTWACMTEKSFQSAANILPNSSGCQGVLSLSSCTASGVGKRTARRHCGGDFHTPSKANLRADSKVQVSMIVSAGFSSSLNSTCKTSSK
eukprot:CAMPEP_0177403772 /NCGR_PEP_ID=MMETSP0368-20130122/61038_1 /TAXON_ID=447022 ORGANISM="Scrippsiella hangoei-like, Strain SHHI-4" /NCGR_SAMPLE_ID=MMETSP0368 /ASSEMBLY_ACC=CAM_ASM_000363 /LENGTH=161 /DNA_ID=CAMNT_0018871795 /DNA_START=155 /DNA_END=640 /DNA_ORIENTATION=-